MKKILTLRKARSIIGRFKKARVLVIGDLIMDHFIWGKVRRISPEAPVPVVEVSEETVILGGAANVAANVRSLGGRSSVSGVVGKDSDGRELVRMLAESAVATDGIIQDPGRPTTIKTRIIANAQQVVRFDRENKEPLTLPVSDKLTTYLKKAVRNSDLVVISDYAKGLISEELVWVATELASTYKKPVLVDPKVEHFEYYTDVTLVTPNDREASIASGIEITDESTLRRAGEVLIGSLGCKALLITRGERGMSLFEETGETHIPTVAKEVFDVSGAGDTVIAVMALSLASGADFKEAAVLSNLAAGVVVAKMGTATVSPEEFSAVVSARLK